MTDDVRAIGEKLLVLSDAYDLVSNKEIIFTMKVGIKFGDG